MSGLEDLLSQIPTSDIASKIGVDEAEVNKAVQLLVPVLVGGLSENAQDPEHASKIESAADSHAGLLDGGVNVDQVDQKKSVRCSRPLTTSANWRSSSSPAMQPQVSLTRRN